jgi:plastocyanin
MDRRRILTLTTVFLASGGLARGQQFQQVTNFPGPQRWCEGVECADVDQDGDLDVFFAEGDGFNSPGTKRQNVLLINQLVEVAPWTFADESVARLGVHVSHAKGVTTGDVTGDGWVDAVYANAFFTDPPFLYINQGAANPGYFTMESATRGLTVSYSSGAAALGDIDDDGDLDLIVNDAYNNGPAARPHLFRNDGTGVFTEDAAALNAPLKSGQMDVLFVDIDGDFDADFFGANKFGNSGGNHYLMLNDGTGSFSNQSSLLSVGTGSVYEAEVGDLDGDDDLDLFFVSSSGFSEGAVRNNLIPSNTLSFTNQPVIPGSVDDNEIVYFDYDMDGDYDVLVGSLGAHEYLYRNDGSLTFVDQSVQIQSVSDSTLDCTVADLDNDGRYDILTAQGESGTFINKFYRNTGPIDSIPPRVFRHQNLASAPTAGPTVVHAQVADQVLDDGVDYVVGTAAYLITTSPQTASVSITAGGFVPASLNIATGTTVTWTNNSGVSRTVGSTTQPYGYASGTIAPGGTYAYTFVSPGLYGVASAPGGLTGQVQVTGSVAIVSGTHAGSQLHRFSMPDTAVGQGLQICYELRFRDWPGNVSVTESRCVPLEVPKPGTPFCFGDGSLATFCPCSNFGVTGRGCANSVAGNVGALLESAGTTSPDAVVLTASDERPTALSIFMQCVGQDTNGLLFGDGLRCANGNLKRLFVKSASGGVASAPGMGDLSITARSAAAGDPIASGSTRYYQTYYRDPEPTFCPAPIGNTFNITNGLFITW